MYGPSLARKVSVRLVIPVAVMYPASRRSNSCSGPRWKSARLLPITPAASWSLNPSQVWKTPIRPVRHHQDNLRNLRQVFS
jgi:hypothetical protein